MGVVLGHPVIAQSLLQNPAIVSRDPVAQIVEQFDDREGLIRRPFWIDEEFQAVAQSGRWVIAFHGAPFVLRFRALAAACSCASLRR